MFQAVINEAGWSSGRFGTGMWVSLAIHAGLFGGLVGVSGRVAELAQEPEVKMFRQLPQPPKGNPNPPQVAQQPVPPKPKPPRRELRQPVKIPPPPPEQAEVPPAPENPDPVDESLPYIPGSDPNGVEKGGVPFVPALPSPIPVDALGSTGEDVLPFGAGMTPPQLLSDGHPLSYTSDAIRAHVSGTLIARCTITREGEVEDCRVIKGLPFMDEAAVESLTGRRYRPVTFQGRSVSVKYTFNIRLRLP